jgi:hypothetical protein
MKPGSTVNDLYLTLTHAPLHFLGGQYIRAECYPGRMMTKTESINSENNIIRIFTNKKHQWQKKIKTKVLN